MMREMRRKDRQLPEEEAVRLLESCRFGVLCTVCADGTPYGIPMNHVLDGRILYMHCASAGGLKLENIARSPRAQRSLVTAAPAIMWVSGSSRASSSLLAARAGVCIEY